MKMIKKVCQLGLLLLPLLVVGMASGQVGHAASLPSDASALSTDSSVYTGALNQGPSWVGTTKPSWTLYTEPTMQAPIAANNVSSTNRITDATDKIYILMSGKFALLSNSSANITSIKPEVMRGAPAGSAAGAATTLAAGSDLVSSPTKSVTASSDYYEIDNVDFSHLYDKLPIYIGFAVTYSNSTTTDYLVYARITASDTITSAWNPGGIFDPTLKIDSTYAGGVSGSVSSIRSSDTKVTGTGISGVSGISVELTAIKDGQTNYYPGTVASDGTFEVPLPQPVEKLITRTSGSKVSIGISEYDNMGDRLTAAAFVYQTLDITANSPNVEVTPDSLADDISGQSDTDILTWIAKQAGIQVSYIGDQLSLSDVTLSADQTGLADKIASLQDGGTLTLKIGAKNSDNIATDNDATVTLTKTDGSLTLSSYSSSLDFGTTAVPSKTTLIAPTNQPSVEIDDTQASGTPWYVTAQATDLMSADGQHTMSGNLVYVNADGTEQSLTKAVQVASGTRDRNLTYPQDVAKNWATSSSDTTSSPEGIYLQAKPDTYSGSDGTTYSGEINWVLSNTPAS